MYNYIYINTHIGAEETCFQGRRTGSRRKEKKSHEGPAKEVERLRPYLFIYIYIYCAYMYTQYFFKSATLSVAFENTKSKYFEGLRLVAPKRLVFLA